MRQRKDAGRFSGPERSTNAAVRGVDPGAGLDRKQPRLRCLHARAIVRLLALLAADHQRAAVAREVGKAVRGLERAVDDAAVGLEIAVRFVVAALPLGAIAVHRAASLLLAGQDGDERIV